MKHKIVKKSRWKVEQQVLRFRAPMSLKVKHHFNTTPPFSWQFYWYIPRQPDHKNKIKLKSFYVLGGYSVESLKIQKQEQKQKGRPMVK